MNSIAVKQVCPFSTSGVLTAQKSRIRTSKAVIGKFSAIPSCNDYPPGTASALDILQLRHCSAVQGIGPL